MSALSQLLQMGIPKSRAAAALKRTKDDAMSAAERIFAGEFDDIESDDEDDDDGAQDQNSQVSAGGPSRSKAQEEFEDVEGDDDIDVDVCEEEYGGPSVNTLADPYANVFFSKDRTETIREPVPDTKSSEEFDGEPRILGMAEWMSGCPEGNEQSFLFQHYTYLESGQLPCPGGCGTTYERSPSDFFAILPDFQAYEKHLESTVAPACANCQQIMCIACGEKRVNSNEPSSKQLSKDQILLHCPNLQGVLIGMGLYMIDQTFRAPLFMENQAGSPVSPPRKRPRQTPIMPLGPSAFDTGGKGPSKGTGYAGNGEEDTSGQERAAWAQKRVDTATTNVLRRVQQYLPTWNRDHGVCVSDHMVHPTALAHLRRRSTFVNDLLRNESLLDMSNREELYIALFDWLKIISNHESLASMMAMPQMRPIKSEPDEEDPNYRVVTYEGASSPRELLENCVIQARASLKGLKGIQVTVAERKSPSTTEKQDKRKAEKALQLTKDEDETARANLEGSKTEDEQLSHFCQRVIDSATSIDRSLIDVKGEQFVHKMTASLPKIPELGDHVIQTKQAGTSAEAVKKIYEEWALRARFQYCDMMQGEDYRHCFNSDIKCAVGQSHRGRVKAIAQEMGMLSTNLPVSWDSSIFLRVDYTRPDCLKAMIIGPSGTPYENGCFIFDVFLPVQYNTIAPKVSSMTTNGGKYRYNPNLYADGKVCLSLLGTWEGPGWRSGKSTLLQVLISIQSLILCDEPYLNEPGWSSDGGTPESKRYSANIRRMVIRDAMSNNIENPPFPFENEIRTHFRLKKDAILTQLAEWTTMDDGEEIRTEHVPSGRLKPALSGDDTGFAASVERLKRLLEGLDAE